MAKPLYNPCTECKEQEAIWHIRARTKFVCEDCRKKIEWDQSKSSVPLKVG